MIKKLALLAVLFPVLCFVMAGCYYRGGDRVVGDKGPYQDPYYDGPYRIDGGVYYYYNGGFYIYDRDGYRFHHYAQEHEREDYEKRHHENHDQYKNNYSKWRDQHPEHPWASRRDNDREKDRGGDKEREKDKRD